MDKALDWMDALILVGGILGAVVVIALIILLAVYLRRKHTKNEVTSDGTDKSIFAKHIMDEYYEEKTRKNEL